MAFYVDEEQLWKCQKHPSKRRRTGVCPTCLRQRLLTLCPECANSRPCSCYPPDSTSTSSSSPSLFQLSLSSAAAEETGRMSTLIETEPAFRKSRSLAVPILRSRSKYVGGGYDGEFIEVDKKPLPNRSKISFWSAFKASKTNKFESHDDKSNKSDSSGATEDYSRMMRSISVAVDAGDSFSTTTTKRRGWYLPSPMKAFRQSKTSKLQIHERSPMRRG